MKNNIISILLLAAFSGCKQTYTINPDEGSEHVCQENIDTILAHMPEWRVIHSELWRSESRDEREGKVYINYTQCLGATVTNGKDTLHIDTYADLIGDEWHGIIRSTSSSKDTTIIRHHNEMMKRLFSNDIYVELKADPTMWITAYFKKQKPDPPEPNYSSYGLEKEDLR